MNVIIDNLSEFSNHSVFLSQKDYNELCVGDTTILQLCHGNLKLHKKTQRRNHKTFFKGCKITSMGSF